MGIERILGAACASALSLVLISPLNAEVIEAYFGMNYVEGSASVPEVMLQEITYIGEGGSVYNTPMPNFYRYTSDGVLTTGLPDGIGVLYQPTYTTIAGGDGETTRTRGATVPIDWDVTSLPFPSIKITSIRVEAPVAGAIWTAAFTTPYTVGLIPFGSGYELGSNSPAPQGDIYGYLSGVGNPVGRVVATSAPRGLEHLVGRVFGDFIFSAAASEPTPVLEICDNSVDDNGDGLIDCAEPNCEGFVDGACNTGLPGICAAGTFVCQSGVQVCNQNQPVGAEGPFGTVTCGDGLDNDCDGLTDAEEPDCTGDVFLTQLLVPKRLNVTGGRVLTMGGILPRRPPPRAKFGGSSAGDKIRETARIPRASTGDPGELLPIVPRSSRAERTYLPG